MPTEKPREGHTTRERLASQSTPTPVPADLSSDQSIDLVRCAQLIAIGEVRFPDNLPDDQAERLGTLVQEISRERMVRFIAHEVARYIADGKCMC